MGQSIEYQQAQPDALFPSVRRLQTVRTEATQLSYYQRHALAYYYHVWQSQSDDGLLTQSALVVKHCGAASGANTVNEYALVY